MRQRPIPFLLAIGITAGAAHAQLIERLSVGTGGVEPNDWCYGDISPDGQWAVFFSEADNLVPGDTNGVRDIFLRDRATGTTIRVSVDSQGQQANGGSSAASVSANGRFTVFTSAATNLVPADTNGEWDVFVHDRVLGATERVSLTSAGAEANGASYLGWFSDSVSDDGRFVCFESDATDLVPGDTNGITDAFVHDRRTGTTERVSLTHAGTESHGGSFAGVFPAISSGGRWVVFQAATGDLVPDLTGPAQNIYVRDRLLGTTICASRAADGSLLPGGGYCGSISADGNRIAFVTYDRAAPEDTNVFADVFVRDLAAGTTILASVSSHGEAGNAGSAAAGSVSSTACISADGRVVAFPSAATNLVPGDTTVGSQAGMDVFLHDLETGLTTRASVARTGEQPDESSLSPRLSHDGRVVTIYSWATNLVPDCTNYTGDLYAHESRPLPGDSISYCIGAPNSVGPGAKIGWSGTLGLVANNLVLNVTAATPGFGLFVVGSHRTRMIYGDGFRCVAGKLTRIVPVFAISASGQGAAPVDWMQFSGLVAGSNLNLQALYRDGVQFNGSDGLSVTVTH